MHLLIMAMVIGVFLHDNPPWDGDDAAPAVLQTVADAPHIWVPIMLGTKILLIVMYGLLCQSVRKRMDMSAMHSDATAAGLRWIDRGSIVYRILVLALYVQDLALGGLVWLRELLPANLVLIDELLFMAPTLATIIAGWWLYYPIDRRMRESLLIRQLDAGQPVHEVWTRGQYVVSQLRHQVALVFLPLILIMGWNEFVRRILIEHLPEGFYLVDALTIGGALFVFIIAPAVIRCVWDTVPLPDGELRDRLTSLCHQYRVGVRELLLWKTFGGMINAAVLGIIAPLRYILLTDALLETMPNASVEAVMAHEVAHVKKHHMFWLAITAISLLGALEIICMLMLTTIATIVAPVLLDDVQLAAVIPLTSFVCTLTFWAMLFGWVSRRFERQADTFAVQHFHHKFASQNDEVTDPRLVNESSARVMTDSLQRVADLNHIATNRRSWRHGSIAWRQDYLMDLVGKPVDELPIDRQVIWIKLGGAMTLAFTVAAIFLMEI